MDARLLFVVSGAFGDVSLAMSFVHGQELASQTAIALPPTLYSVNQDRLPLQTYRYSSVKDIRRAATTWKARIVFLLSGYGFPIERLTSPLGMRRLVRYLRNQSCCVVTTDPFLGSASTVAESRIPAMLPPTTRWWHRLLVAPLVARRARGIVNVLNGTSNALRDVVHIYPMPIDAVVNRARLRRISFFNPRLTQHDSAWDQSAHAPKNPTDATSSEKAWLFVIAPSDVALQQRQWGSAGFVSQLVRLFEQTRGMGRRPVLVGPPSLIRDMTAALPGSIESELVQFCSYPEFAARLLNAEYAFYWNNFSCSAVLVRLVRRLPVFFFDQGHVAHFSQQIYEDGLRCYYGGWVPEQLQQGSLNAEVLADAAAKQALAVDALIAYWKQSPTPQELIDRLLHDSTV